MNITLHQDEFNLNHFDFQIRKDTLQKLIKGKTSSDILYSTSASMKPFNLHCHSFFSYNGYGLSPTALVWKAYQNNFYAIGLIDFDVLDGINEFFEACSLCGIRGCAGFETRIFVPQFASFEINSPGEPGISYHIGMGFVHQRVKKVEVLAKLKELAQSRIRKMIEQLNKYLSPLIIDYSNEVLPLTPSGNPTERHLCTAYYKKSLSLFSSNTDNLNFWSDKLKYPVKELENIFQSPVDFQSLIRSKLMKSGGPGYVLPKPENFPTLIEVNEFILSNHAIPTFAWLDGTSSGEQKIEELLNVMTQAGVCAVNIIPDRNWNIKDPEVKKQKIQNLTDFVNLANELYLPVFIGTELNAPGQKFVDDLDTDELKPFYNTFLDGVHIAYAHTVLEKIAGMGFTSPWAQNYFPTRKERYNFFREIGEKLTPVTHNI